MDITDGATRERIIDKYRPTVAVKNAEFSITGGVEDIDDDELRTALGPW